MLFEIIKSLIKSGRPNKYSDASLDYQGRDETEKERSIAAKKVPWESAGMALNHPRLREVKVKRLNGRIFWLDFPTRYLMASTFLRFQEHYESPRFKDKIFTLEEYMDWYALSYDGRFSYYEDWCGFNIPSHILAEFHKGSFNPLTDKERAFLDLFREIKEPFYVIGTSRESGSDTLEYELAHALYYTDRNYRDEVNSIFEGVDLSGLNEFLGKENGYCADVFLDEAQAYLIEEGYDWLSKLDMKSNVSLKKARHHLQELFESHLKRL